jgi:hypothetical protein
MKKVHCAFADQVFERSLQLCEDTSVSIGGIDKFYAYRPDDLHADNFYKNNKHILTQQPGAGWWAWKPFVIMQTMQKVEAGDIVLYTDAGVSIIDNLDILFEITSKSNDKRMLFATPWIHGPHTHRMFTTRDCFVEMYCDTPKYWDNRMLNGAFHVWMKTPTNVKILIEWLKYCITERAISHLSNVHPELPGHNSHPMDKHRWDQSILSLLSMKYGRELYRDPSQLTIGEKGNFPNSPYEQLFNHHSGNI